MTAYTHFDSWYVGGAGFWPSTVLIIGVALCIVLVVLVCTGKSCCNGAYFYLLARIAALQIAPVLDPVSGSVSVPVFVSVSGCVLVFISIAGCVPVPVFVSVSVWFSLSSYPSLAVSPSLSQTSSPSLCSSLAVLRSLLLRLTRVFFQGR